MLWQLRIRTVTLNDGAGPKRLAVVLEDGRESWGWVPIGYFITHPIASFRFLHGPINPQ